ncbi:MAG TPA: N-acetylmuramoyl-L-alanine amidase, partial [Anaerolineae bacterium]
MIGRVSALLAKPLLGAASSPLPPGTSLADVSLVTDVVTVVLNLPESVLYNANVAVGSDSIDLAVVQSLQDLPLHVFHVLTIDPHDPQGGPKAISSFVHLRPVTTKPYEQVTVTPTVPGVAQPQAAAAAPMYALSGKTVYLSAGHGWYYNPSSGWSTQRPPYQAIVEDMNNAEAVDQYLVSYLRQAGADVFPAREPSLNPSEVVIANTGAGYAETGIWTASSLAGTGYKNDTYHYALTVSGAAATASATWTANIPASGWYPVYAWYFAGTNRATDAHYEIDYPAGTHVAIIDQTKHGSTWRYLGTFYFRTGEVARVRLLNMSSNSGSAVIADAVRFGGGIGDYNSGGGVSSQPRWEEASRYWTYYLGAPASVFDSYPGSTTCDYTAPDLCDDITARPRYADWENIGSGDDAVFLSWHTNGYDGTARGTVSYVYDNSDPSYTRVAGSVDLQSAVHDQVISAIHAGWDPSWIDRGKQQMNLGEVRLATSMPSMLIEMGFHDNQYDAASLKDPRFDQLLARATYQGILKYYAQKAGVTPHYLPEPPERFMMRNTGNGSLTLSWQAPASSAFGTNTDPASGYRVYLSNDGFAWDEGRDVAGTSLALSGYSTNQVLYARITAVNVGGESFPTPVLAVRVGNTPRALIVQGFDSIDPTMDVIQNVGSYPAVARIYVDRMNRQNYIVQHAIVITEAFDSAVHQAVGAGDLALNTYQFVDWFAGRQSVG